MKLSNHLSVDYHIQVRIIKICRKSFPMKNLQLTLTFDMEGCLMRLDSYHDVRTVSRD